jgi:hypothetical protein
MSQVIRISESTYNHLESLAKGFDTPGNVIDRLLKFYEDYHGKVTPSVKPKQSIVASHTPIKTLNPDNPGDLTHSKILEGWFGDQRVNNWVQLVYTAHKYAIDSFDSFEALQKVTLSNVVKGSFTESGYHAYPDLGISIQGQDSNNSWRSAMQLAREINVSRIEVLIQWRNNEKAAYPGQKGRLFWEAEK